MIDRKEVEYVARLARIAVPDDEIPELVKELASIVGYVEQIQKLKLDDVPALSHGGKASDVFRPDSPGPSLPVESALANAPDRVDRFFRVPRVIAEP